MSGATITLAIAIITCVIGVLTFVSGRLTKAEKEGRLAEKLDTCARGIEEIKTKLTAQDAIQNQQNVAIEKHEQRLDTLESRLQVIERGGTHLGGLQ